MSKLNSPTSRLALLAFCLIGLGFLTVILNLMILWFVLFAVLCGYFLFRYRNQIRRQDCILGVIFAGIAMISHPLMGFFVLPGYVASAARMRDIPHPIVLYHPGKKNELWKTMGWILAAGSCLGAVSYTHLTRSYLSLYSHTKKPVLSRLKLRKQAFFISL